ncbi:MAG: 3'-5' exonuclease, partial [Lactococcus sp.]
SKAAIELDISDEKEDLLLLRHVLLSHHGQLEYGSPVRPKIMEAEIIHQIDMMDASMMMMMTALNNVEPGQSSQRVFALENRNFYKPLDN